MVWEAEYINADWCDSLSSAQRHHKTVKHTKDTVESGNQVDCHEQFWWPQGKMAADQNPSNY